MTIIVGYTDKEGTWLASDKRMTAGSLIAGSTQKVFVASENLAFGVCGALRDLNVVRHIFRPPSLEFNANKEDLCETYLVSQFVPSLIDVLDSQSRLTEDEEAPGLAGWCGSLLVAVGPNLFGVYNDFAVAAFCKYGAVGSGSDFALSSLSTMDKGSLSGDVKCKMAIQVASKFDTNCDNHIEIVKMR